MNDGYYPKTPVRVPVRMVNGQWEFFYGGNVPVREGTFGELLIQKERITDPKFLRALRKRSEHLLLDEGTALMVALSARDQSKLDERYKALLQEISPEHLSNEYYWTSRPAGTRFVSVVIGPPLEGFPGYRRQQPGGVWLQLEGAQPKGLLVSSVELPEAVSEEPCQSLNHAFTLLSEVFEPWRQSHTGNVYQRMLYQESNGKWYPLERLRRAAEATEEHALIKQRWDELVSLFSQEIGE